MRGLFIKKYKGTSSCVEVPERIGSKKVIAIDSCAFYENKNITDVTIPSSCYDIDDFAFIRCENLKSVRILSEDLYIGSGAFEGCKNLENLSLNFKQIKLSIRPFKGCEKLTNKDGFIILENDVEKIFCDYVVQTSKTKVIIPDDITRIDGACFYEKNGGSNIEELLIPSSVRVIGDRVFCDCDKLKIIDLPDGLESIGHFAFSNAKSLKHIDIPAGVNRMGGAVFNNCENIEIISKEGSYAQKYASDYKIRFICE